MRRDRKRASLILVLAGMSLIVAAAAPAQPKERYTAIIATQGGPPTQLIVSIKSWTSDDEAKALKATLASGGPDAAEKAIGKLNKGYFSFIGSMGWSINAARSYPIANGGRRIVALTTRPIMFGEAMEQTATLNYPFGIVELQVDESGKGTGSVIGMARITMDDAGGIKIDPYAGYAYELLRVRREN